MMTNNKDRKKRASNLSHIEEKLLISLVKKYKAIIESKVTDAITSKQKNEAWRIISSEFNTQSTNIRDALTLKNKYENLKKTAKKKFSDEKTFTRGTGGGPPKKSEITDVDEDIKDLLTNQITGFSSKFDDDQDSEYESEYNSVEYEAQEENEEQIILEIDDNNDTDDNNNEENAYKNRKADFSENFIKRRTILFDNTNTVAALRTSISKNLIAQTPKMSSIRETFHFSESKEESAKDNGEKVIEQGTQSTPLSQSSGSGYHVPRKRTNNNILQTKLGSWAAGKLELIHLQKEQLTEEHSKKMRFLDKKHDLELEFMQKEHEARLKNILGNH